MVPVLMISCHVSEKPKIGPAMPHTTITPKASMKADVPPVQRVTAVELYRALLALAIRSTSLRYSPLSMPFPANSKLNVSPMNGSTFNL